MNNLCYGMKTINVTQVPGDSYSHPNWAMDLAGADSGIDFWYAQGDWKCVAGPWGNGTYFFVPVNAKGETTKVKCADGKNRIVTLALTHSNSKYVKTKVGVIYKNGQPMYEEGTKGRATGNHIHYEVAEGVQTTKHYDKKLGVYRMDNELDPMAVTFVNRAFSKVAANSAGKTRLKYCDKLTNSSTVSTASKKASGTALVAAKYAAYSYNKTFAGKYAVTPVIGLKMRDGAGTNQKILAVLPYNSKVENFGYFTKTGNTNWYYVVATIGSTVYKGFVDGTYLKKV